MKRSLPIAMTPSNANVPGARTAAQYTDTDPHMLFAIWEMEFGADPETSLNAMEGSTVVYDKFRPRLSARKSA